MNFKTAIKIKKAIENNNSIKEIALELLAEYINTSIREQQQKQTMSQLFSKS